MTVKEKLHRLVDELPPSETAPAQRYLEYLRLRSSDPVLRAPLRAPVDDEPLTAGDRRAIRESDADIPHGRVRALTLLPRRRAR